MFWFHGLGLCAPQVAPGGARASARRACPVPCALCPVPCAPCRAHADAAPWALHVRTLSAPAARLSCRVRCSARPRGAPRGTVPAGHVGDAARFQGAALRSRTAQHASLMLACAHARGSLVTCLALACAAGQAPPPGPTLGAPAVDDRAERTAWRHYAHDRSRQQRRRRAAAGRRQCPCVLVPPPPRRANPRVPRGGCVTAVARRRVRVSGAGFAGGLRRAGVRRRGL